MPRLKAMLEDKNFQDLVLFPGLGRDGDAS